MIEIINLKGKDIIIVDELSFGYPLDFEKKHNYGNRKMKTPEELKKYKTDYYRQHKDHCDKLTTEWRKSNPLRAKGISDRWLAKRPHYQRDYRRKRNAAVEPLIFQFLDNGFAGDVDGYIAYLREQGIPEQHIHWFKVDVQKHLGVS